MSSSTPAGVEVSPDNSIEKKVYNIIERLSEYLPVVNDRNRLGFDLYKFVTNEGDEPLTILKNAKVKITGVTMEQLADKIIAELKEI